VAQTKNGRPGTTADVAALLKAEAPTGRFPRPHRGVIGRRCQAPDAVRATLPMIAASSFGRDHIGQWLVGRST
jgi:hypothetical protein